jgi:hypothetical protein
MVYTDSIVIWEPEESTLEKKFQSVSTVCKDVGSNVDLGKCVVIKISLKTGVLEKVKCNNHEIKNGELKPLENK